MINRLYREMDSKYFKGVIAQLVEQWTENPCVAGSTPARTTCN